MDSVAAAHVRVGFEVLWFPKGYIRDTRVDAVGAVVVAGALIKEENALQLQPLRFGENVSWDLFRKQLCQKMQR
jgi:hypothetical protein